MKNPKLVFFMLVFALAIFIISFSIGRYPISPYELINIVFSKIGLCKLNCPKETVSIALGIRLPRIIGALLVGASLSGAGASYQGVFRNPLVSPNVIGVSDGAAFGAALCISLSYSTTTIQLAAFSFGILAVFLTYSISRFMKNNRILGLVLSGILIGSTFGAMTSMIKFLADPTDKLPEITFWLMGSLGSFSGHELKFLALTTFVGLCPLLLLRWKINLLTLDEDEAKSIGINVSLLRIIVILCATLVTTGSICICGIIGWVGLVVPHIARLIVGPNYSKLLPCSIFIGGIYLLIVDDLCRNLSTLEIPLGVLTSFVGAPILMFLIFKRGVVKN